MSLNRLALRLISRKALLDRTLAETRVEDSSIVNLEEALDGAPQPVILIFTDDSEFDPTGKELVGGGWVTLVMVLSITGATEVELDGETVTQFALPATDEAMEMSLDIMELQIKRALADPDSVWGTIWRQFVVTVGKWKSQRGGSTKEGVRFAARQITVPLELIYDPVVGGTVEDINPGWSDLLAAMEADTDPDFAGLKPLLQGLILGAPLPSWKQAMIELGINRESLRAIGLAPLRFHPEGPNPVDGLEPAELDTIVITGNGLTTENSDPDGPV